ncbi:hypothetical protein CA51_40060 [Rosistilla oblonga]|uniref:thiol-disulfide oxidoreductase DCC family protein n=1 Tax=Rosistilla oblonga TaxID=2527990 RepID=UPI00118B030B|nr:DUF393 domain-containing protein [Rosistilla oblonga]QDV14112.1 hypothetical protein CA51_40060 [Rosistilla oblonga]
MFKSPDLADPDSRPDADVVIFDGQCNFCRGGVERLNWLDRRNRLAFISLHDERVAERYPDLSHDDLMQEMFVVDGQGKRHGGSDAVRYLSRQLALLWPIMPVLHLPGSAGVWRWMYKQVAKRRYRLAGKNCDSGSCKIHLNS